MTDRRIRLQPDALLSRPVFIASFLWSLVAHFGDTADNGFDSFPLRIAVLFAVQVLWFLFPLIAWFVVCPRVNMRWAIWVLGVAVTVGGAVRGAALGYLLYLADLSVTPDWVFRMLASMTNMVVFVVVLWTVVSEVRAHQYRRRQLVMDRDQLLLLQDTTQESLQQLDERATEEIRASIMESLRASGPVSTGDLLGRLRVTIDDVVRPLSHRLAAEGTAWIPPQPPIEDLRVDWGHALRSGLDPIRIRPVLMTATLLWLALPRMLVHDGPVAAMLSIVVGFSFGPPAFGLGRWVGARLSRNRGAAVHAAHFAMAVLAAGEVIGVTSLLYMIGRPSPYQFVIEAPIFALFVSAPMAVAEAARAQGLAIEGDLEAVTNDLRWTLARAREQHRQHQRALAHALHGRIQASLASAIVRLERAAARGADAPELLAALQSEVTNAVTELDFRNTHPESLDDVIDLTRRNWAGAAELTFAIDAAARAALVKDELAAVAVNDLIPEMVFNSFRHGRATLVGVDLRMSDDRTLMLSVTDNGVMDEHQHRRGLGSHLLDEACITWSRTRKSGSTVTACHLPCLAAQSPALTFG